MDSEPKQPELTPTPAPDPPAVQPPKRPKKPRWFPADQLRPPGGAYPVPAQVVPAFSPDAFERIQVPSKVIMRAVDTLGLPRDRWDRAKLMAVQELGQYMSIKFTGRVLLVNSFDSLEQIQNAYKVAAEIANDPKRSAEDRLTAVGMIAKITEAYAKFSDQMMTLAEKSAPAKREVEKPRNLPPTFAVQVNIPGATAPSPVPGIPAKSGINGEEQPSAVSPTQD